MKTTTFDTPNNIPPSNENTTTFSKNKNKEQSPDIEIIALKYPDLPPNANNTMTQRTIRRVTAAVIVNYRIITPVTLQLRPSKRSTNLNVLKAHKNIFSAMKLIDSTLKLIIFQNETIDTTSKGVGNGNGNEKVTPFAYEIRISPDNANMLKNLLCNISNEGNSNLRFIPYGMQSISKQGTMRNIILHHNIFLQNMTIVHIVNISNNEKDNVQKLFESSLYFSRFEPTRKVSEGIYSLVTNRIVLTKA